MGQRGKHSVLNGRRTKAKSSILNAMKMSAANIHLGVHQTRVQTRSNWLDRLRDSTVNIMKSVHRKIAIIQPTKPNQNHVPSSSRKKKEGQLVSMIRPILYSLAVSSLMFVKKVSASAGVIGQQVPKSNVNPWQGVAVWLSLFTLSALLHGAESAITKISPYKVQEFAEEEGEGSPFATLSGNLTRLLSTILLTTTACSIYSTALFVATAVDFFPQASLGTITALLTAVTLFFGELLPKAMAVSNSELVARMMVPFISKLATVLMPVTVTITFLSDVVLRLSGLKSKEDRSVSEDMLRMVVDEAVESTEGIETGEGQMIKAVLDMQDTTVEKIMQPRVDIVAVPEDATATEILKCTATTKYSRLPVYRGDVDNIIGVVFSKDLLDYMSLPRENVNKDDLIKYRPQMIDSWSELNASQLMKPTYFIPETMTTWNALQEMRRRRLHMAIVVDEYGGTSGLVTFEDILEEVVGEIYDEDDDEEQKEDSTTIFKGVDNVFEMKGFAELDDVCEALGLEITEELKGEYSTIGGLLCAQAGEIPKEGDEIVFGGYKFTVLHVEDNRRIIDLTCRLVESGSPSTLNGVNSGNSGDGNSNINGNSDSKKLLI